MEVEPRTSERAVSQRPQSPVNIVDAVFLLSSLFGQTEPPDCEASADANDDGELNIADAVKILAHLFANAGPLPQPFGACGIDPTADDLDCASFLPYGGT